tara:strand:- start:1361 stop:1471 length:111 start_codon:yes stop_codon:yes gene_type:complete
MYLARKVFRNWNFWFGYGLFDACFYLLKIVRFLRDA